MQRACAEILGAEDALLFSSGYLANLGVIAALADRHTITLQDRLNHASLLTEPSSLVRKWCVTSMPRSKTYTVVPNSTKGCSLWITETVSVWTETSHHFPICFLRLKLEPRCFCWTSRTPSGFGTFWTRCRGKRKSSRFGILTLAMSSFGKALASQGAVVVGDKEIMGIFVNSQERITFDTSCLLGGGDHASSFNLVQTSDDRRQRLSEAIAFFRQCARALRLPVQDPTQPSNR